MIVRYIALLGFTLIIAGLSLLIYKLPFQILFQEFHDTYLVIANGKLSGYLIGPWFLIGGYRTTLIMLWDKNEAYFNSLSYRAKAFLLVPLSMFYRFDISWYKIPTIEYLNSKH